MIKTLKITGFLAVLATIGCVTAIVMLGRKGNPEMKELLDSESVVQIFKKKTTRTTSSTDQVSPLVKQAKKLALRLNPPKPKSVVKKQKTKSAKGTPRSTPKPKVKKINTKFDLIATCKYEDQADKSMALLRLPAKGLKWYRQGQEINHLTIQQINDGNIVLYKAGVENSIVTMPVINKKSLLKSDAAETIDTSEITAPPEFPAGLFEKLMGATKDQGDAKTSKTPTPIPSRKKPKAQTAPKPVSEEEKQQNLDDTISNIKRIMERSKDDSQQETNKTFEQLLKKLEEKPLPPAE